MIYAGIGSRSTPPQILSLMEALGSKMALDGHRLRSGHAAGADQAFERGHQKYSPLLDIYTPRSALNWPALMEHASQFHPNWAACVAKGDYVCRLHARNSAIVLGPDLASPVSCIYFWHPTDRPGGTGQALRVAQAYGIPCHLVSPTP